MRKFLFRLGERNIFFEDFTKVRIADRAANRKRQPFAPEEIAALREQAARVQKEKIPLDVKSLMVSGGELMAELNLTAGPLVGNLQRFLLEEILEKGQQINTCDSLLRLAKEKIDEQRRG